MNDKLWLSIILPVYNGGATLHRPLESIIKQDFPIPYEVVIINDNSEDNSLEVINSYMDRLPINLINVNLDVHCAGNSRNIGLDNVRGEWVTFIDQDDEFEDEAFKNVFNIIEENRLKYVCCTLLYEYDEDTGEIYRHTNVQDNIDVWLHGKYYNRVNLFSKYRNIRFNPNLRYLEDLYFNNQVLQVLFELNLINRPTFTYYTVETYKWYEHSKSTHNKKVEGNYVFNHWGIANHYCDVVFPSIIKMKEVSKNLESDYSILQMVYADIAYLYVQYNVLVFNYGQQDKIVSSLEDNICKYLPKLLTQFRITNIFDYIETTIQFTLEQSQLTEEQQNNLIIYTFPTWWSMMLTKCSN